MFNLCNYFLGNKDLLVEYKDGVTNYTKSGRNYLPISFFNSIEHSRNVKIQRITFALHGKVDKVYNDHIVLKENGVTRLIPILMRWR